MIAACARWRVRQLLLIIGVFIMKSTELRVEWTFYA